MRYRISADVLSAPLAGETVLLDMRSRSYFRLNATAACTWEALERGRSLDELLEDLEQRFAAPREVIETEIRELLASMCDRGLIAESA